MNALLAIYFIVGCGFAFQRTRHMPCSMWKTILSLLLALTWGPVALVEIGASIANITE